MVVFPWALNLIIWMNIPYAPRMEYESLHLPKKSTSFVGKYSIHGASGYDELCCDRFRVVTEFWNIIP